MHSEHTHKKAMKDHHIHTLLVVVTVSVGGFTIAESC